MSVVYGVYGVGGGRANSEDLFGCWVKSVGGTTGDKELERAPGYIVYELNNGIRKVLLRENDAYTSFTNPLTTSRRITSSASLQRPSISYARRQSTRSDMSLPGSDSGCLPFPGAGLTDEVNESKVIAK